MEIFKYIGFPDDYMKIGKDTQQEILSAIAELGSTGGTITELEPKAGYERHTLSKYLLSMQSMGLIYHKPIGKAKVWYINKAPLGTVLNAKSADKTYTEQLLSDIISAFPQGLMIIDKNYTILFQNDFLHDQYGDITGQFFYHAVLGHDNPLHMKQISDIAWQKSVETTFEIKDKYHRILSIAAKRFANPDDSFAIMLVIEDVTDKRHAEEQFTANRQLLEAERATLNKSAIVVETDLSGKITYVNDKFVQISGYSRRELIGHTHRKLKSGEHDKDFYANIWDTITKGKVWTGQIKNRRKDGSTYWVASSIAPVLGSDGMPVKYIAIRFDISKYLTEKSSAKRRGK